MRNSGGPATLKSVLIGHAERALSRAARSDGKRIPGLLRRSENGGIRSRPGHRNLAPAVARQLSGRQALGARSALARMAAALMMMCCRIRS